MVRARFETMTLMGARDNNGEGDDRPLVSGKGCCSSFDTLMKVLVGLHGVAAVFHLSGSIIIAALGAGSFDYEFQIVNTFFKETAPLVFERKFNEILVGPYWPWPFAFPLVTLFSHLTHIALYFTGHYRRWILSGINPLRWIEYSFTAAEMLISIALLSRVDDIQLLIQLFFSMWGVNIFGLFIEMRPGRRKPRLPDSLRGTKDDPATTEEQDAPEPGIRSLRSKGAPSLKTGTSRIGKCRCRMSHYGLGIDLYAVALFVFSSFFATIVWIPIFSQFIPNAEFAPSFVWVIMMALPLMFSLFAVNMVIVEAGIVSYVVGEIIYTSLSLFAKTLLWMTVAGGGVRKDVPPFFC